MGRLETDFSVWCGLTEPPTSYQCRKMPYPDNKFAKIVKQMFNMFVIFVVILWKRYDQKLRIMILHHFVLIKFSILWSENPKTSIAWYLDVWDPWEPLFADLNNFKEIENEIQTCFSNIRENLKTTTCGTLRVLEVWVLKFDTFKLWNLESLKL